MYSDGREILDCGQELKGGVTEYLKDIVYLTAIVQVACVLTNHAYYLLLAVCAGRGAPSLWFYERCTYRSGVFIHCRSSLPSYSRSSTRT